MAKLVTSIALCLLSLHQIAETQSNTNSEADPEFTSSVSSSFPDSNKLLGHDHSSSSSKLVYRSYQNSIYCSPKFPIQYPKSIEEIQTIVKKAIFGGYTVKGVGSRHSIHDVICTDGMPINLKFINYCIDNEDGTATFGGGIELIEALTFLESRGRSLINIPSFGGISMAGATGTGAHGSSLRHATSISDQLVRLTIIDGEGEVRIIDEASGFLNAARVHLGLLGIVVDVTVQTVPLHKMVVQNSPEPESILFDGTALQWANEYDWFELWWFPNLQKVVVSKGMFRTDNPQGNASTHFIPDEDPLIIAASREAFEGLQSTRNQLGLRAFEEFSALSLYDSVTGKPPIFSEDGVNIKNPATGFTWRLQTNKCTKNCAWKSGHGTSVLPNESALAFDIEQFSSVFEMIRRVLSEYPATFSIVGIMVRFSKPSSADMSIARDRYSFTVECPVIERTNPLYTAKDGIGAYQAIAQESVLNHGGRPHWGKNGLYYTTRKILDKTLSPAHRQHFIKAMKTYDPNGIFLNKFGQRILGLSDEVDKDPKETRCALLDTCVCSSSSDCAPFQKCIKLNGFPVCEDLINLNNLKWSFQGSSHNKYNILNYTLHFL